MGLIERFLAETASSAFSYPDVGLSRIGAPEGYTTDHNRIVIGHGDGDWEKAKEAIRNWKMFDFEWVELCWPNTPIEENQNVAVMIRHFGFYSLNAAKIVYVIDEPERFGFAYGTLLDHGESGEERFSVEISEQTGDVWYDLYAFSKPKHILAKLGYPLVRNLQKQFAKDSKAAILRAIQPC